MFTTCANQLYANNAYTLWIMHRVRGKNEVVVNSSTQNWRSIIFSLTGSAFKNLLKLRF
ncbi:MAG: hypothetical protein ACTS4Z_01560 [Candidatus Hodgkinia cicadicola]